MGRTQRCGDPDRKAQEAPQFQWRAEQSLERLAAGIVEHEHTALAYQLRRPDGPGAIKFILQSKLVSQTIEAEGCGVLCSEQHC